eukprot:TRINITY_DN32_c0_g1_i2.p2 TRINITY_DN32_c0_g1~~TRINITY_DN32_c0_g1_i2.p2  ORF type:complete len:216 (-),score=59.53 TRINITY_DN32_c0_g1_i2:36-683(-)
MFSVVVLVALVSLVQASELTFQIEPKKTLCLYEDLSGQATASWEVVRGGLLDVNIAITGPNGESHFNELYFEGRGTPGYKTFTAQTSGRHSFCFDNEMSRWTPKVVTFELKQDNKPAPVETKADLPPGAENLAKQEHITPLQESISKISGALSRIESEQSYYRKREHRHRNTAEQTCERVQWWSIYETSAIVLISVLQVFVLRRWFDKRSVGGGV